MEGLVTRKARQMVGGRKQWEPKVGKCAMDWRSGEGQMRVHLGLEQCSALCQMVSKEGQITHVLLSPPGTEGAGGKEMEWETQEESQFFNPLSIVSSAH